MKKCKICGDEYPHKPKQKLKICYKCRKIRQQCLRIIKLYNEGKTCKICGKRYLPEKNKILKKRRLWKAKYCSKKCHTLDRENNLIKKCKQCGRPFGIPKNSWQTKKQFCTKHCEQIYVRHQKCERCGRIFSDKKVRPLCLDCLFDDFATKCLNCGKTLKKNRKRIITEENYNYLLNTLNFSPKKLKYFKISNMQYCDINCAIQKETPYYYKGIADEEYPPEFNRVLKDKIIERDGSKCQLCPTNFNLAVHHIDYNKQNIDPTNLITLCAHHHMKTNWNRAYWVNLFSNYQLWRGLL